MNLLLSKEETKLQKKGVENLSQEELKQWIEICERNANDIKYKKARKSWVASSKSAEKRLDENKGG